MKIEIELEEIERLRSENKILLEKNIAIERQLSELDESVLRLKAVNLSKKLFENYMAAVFEALGFDNDGYQSLLIDGDLTYQLGKDWWKSDRVKFELGASITGQFRRAYLQIGVITKEDQQRNDDDVYSLEQL